MSADYDDGLAVGFERGYQAAMDAVKAARQLTVEAQAMNLPNEPASHVRRKITRRDHGCQPRNRVAVNRKDWTLGNWHLIRRTAQTTQYGTLLWSLHGRHTLDVWVGRTLWTLRRL